MNVKGQTTSICAVGAATSSHTIFDKLKRDLQRVQNLAAEMEREQMELYAQNHGVTVDELMASLKKSDPKSPIVDRVTGDGNRLSRDLP